MGEVISIQEAHRARRRQRDSQLHARCRELMEESLEVWRRAGAGGEVADRLLCRRRVRMLGELLAYTERLP